VWSLKKEEPEVDVVQELQKLKKVKVEFVDPEKIDYQQLVNDNDPKFSVRLQEEIEELMGNKYLSKKVTIIEKIKNRNF